jgi:diguanylate cyclase (GGDEF)-like protein
MVGIGENGLVHLRQELARKTAQLSALNESILEILASLKQGELLGHLLASAGACVPAADSGLVALVEDGGRSLTVGASYGFDFNEVEKSSWLKTLSAFASAPSPVAGGARAKTVALPGGRRSVAATSLEGDGKKPGFIALFSIFPDAFTAQDSEALEQFAGLASLAVRDARLRAEIADLGVTDTLTGLLNQKGFNEFAEREFKRACRFGDPLAVLKIELDGLKSINDQYGRSVGDQLLRGIGRRLQRQLRAVDIIGRCGPGSFQAVLAETTPGKATWVMNRIRHAVMDAPYETRRGEMKVAVSTGTASLDRGCTNAAQLVEWAELARLKRV